MRGWNKEKADLFKQQVEAARKKGAPDDQIRRGLSKHQLNEAQLNEVMGKTGAEEGEGAETPKAKGTTKPVPPKPKQSPEPGERPLKEMLEDVAHFLKLAHRDLKDVKAQHQPARQSLLVWRKKCLKAAGVEENEESEE